MEPDEEMEAFDVTERDFLSACDPLSNRRYMSKEEATYGIWSRDRSDQRSFGRTASKPVSFVKSNAGTVGSTTGNAEEEEGPLHDQDDDGDAHVPLNRYIDSSDSETNSQNDEVAPPAKTTREYRSFRATGNAESSQQRLLDMGSWEKHTKGIGMKLLLKMGFERGKGLGRDLQGRAVPVQAVKRKGKGTIGAYGAENSESPSAQATTPTGKVSGAKGKERTLRWKKTEAGNKLPTYLTIDYASRESREDRLLREHQFNPDDIDDQMNAFRFSQDSAPMKIVDLTSKERKEYSSFKERQQDLPPQVGKTLWSSKKHPSDIGAIDQLIDLVDQQLVSAEMKLLALSKKASYDEHLKSNLVMETKRIDNEIEKNLKELNRSQEVLHLINLVVDKAQCTSDPEEFIHFLCRACHDACQKLGEEFRMFALDDFLIEMAKPALQEFLADRDLVKHRTEIMDVFNSLGSLAPAASSRSTDARNVLLWEVLTPAVRRFFLDWNPRQPDPAVDLIDSWKDSLPTWLLHNYQVQLIIPKLLSELENWNPLVDDLPLHVWIHPWLPLVEMEKLELMMATIRQKLTFALQHWHPSDSSAKPILTPWQNVFPAAVWQAFMLEAIVPKLESAMHAFVLNPANQDLTAWNWVFAWHGVVDDSCFVDMLERFFFPKFLRVLRAWLDSSADYMEVANWFSGWKSSIPESIRSHSIVQQRLVEALTMMNSAVDSEPTDFATPQVAVWSAEQPQTFQAYNRVLPMSVRSAADTGETGTAYFDCHTCSSLREVVERRASERNLLFAPDNQRSFNGQRLYRLGKLRIYFERTLIFVQERSVDGERFRPIGLDELLSRA